MTQKEAVIKTLERLGGIATLATLNIEVFQEKECQWRTRTPFASIRRIVQLSKEIIKIKPGLYALADMRNSLENCGALTASTDTTGCPSPFDHAYYQGLLLIVGNLHKLHTFAPSQDKNRLFYDGRRVADLSSLTTLPPFSYPETVKRAATIDAVWLNERRMPHSFFEIEHTTDIQNSLLKFLDLRDFNARMVIVADNRRRPEFDKKLRFSAFDELRRNSRVHFLAYDDLVGQYEQEMRRRDFPFLL